MDDDILKEAIEYRIRRLPMIIFFFTLITIPFVFAILSYIELKKCQGSESNGCPSLSLPAVPDTPNDATLQGYSQSLHTNISTNQDVQELI